MIVDTIIIHIEDMREESVLAILAALQAYEKNAFDKHTAFYQNRVGAGDLELNLIIVRAVQYERFDFIWNKCLNHLRLITIDLNGALLWANKHDLKSVVVLREDVARNLAKTSGKHLAQTYGIMIGSETGSLPDVSALAPKDYANKPEWMLITAPVCSMNFQTTSPINLLVDLDEKDKDLELRISLCFMSAAYGGRLSFESYLMSALKKPVFEISDDKHLYKWSNPNYINASTSDDEAVTRGISLCLSRLVPGK